MTLRPLSIALAFSALLLPPVLADAPAASTGVKLTEQPDRLRIEMNGELFTDYIIMGEERYFPLFYPVLGPGQVPMTRRFPLEKLEGEDTDHPHHQSLWFAHSEVNGHSFWAVQPSNGKAPGKTVHKRFVKIESGEKEGGFVSENDYVASDGTVVMSDTRTVRFLAPEQADGPRILDITIAFHASNGPVTFGDQKDAGMAIRVASDLQVEKRTQVKDKMLVGSGHLLNSEGVVDKDTWGKRARWLDAYGEVGGKPVGVAIMDHPSNPRHPTYWHSRTYGLATANVFGKRHFEAIKDNPKAGELVLPAGETLSFRWRFAFHQGDPVKAKVEELYQQFAAD